MKRKIEIIGQTLFLLVTLLIIHRLWIRGVYSRFPILPFIMITATAIYIAVSYILQILNKRRSAVILGTVVFVLTCICFVYALEPVDFKAFVICIILVVRRSISFAPASGCNLKSNSAKKLTRN